MTFWTFLDKNGEGLFWLAVITLCFGFGTCGDGKGCRFKCDSHPSIQIESSDGGTP